MFPSSLRFTAGGKRNCESAELLNHLYVLDFPLEAGTMLFSEFLDRASVESVKEGDENENLKKDVFLCFPYRAILI